MLHLPLEEGGQGLVHITSKIASFRLKTAQQILCGSGPAWLSTVRMLLRRAGGLGYDRQLFLLDGQDFPELKPFYSSVLQAWGLLKTKRAQAEKPGPWLFEEPLFF